jgi:galactose mutarotase-like enzyme
LITLSNAFLSVLVSPLGAELQSILDVDGHEWLWQGDPTFWSGRSPLLFPVVGRSVDGRVRISGRDYDMPPHGFARTSTFTCLSHEATRCRFMLQADERTRAVYPFAFRLEMTYALEGATLRMEARIENCDVKEVPFSFGFHPAFAWPLPGCAGRAHHVHVQRPFPAQMWRPDADGLLAPIQQVSPFIDGSLNLSPELFEAGAMVFDAGEGGAVRYGVEGRSTLELRYQDLPHLAFWTKPGAPFLCIEPWHGLPPLTGASSDLLDRPGILMLQPQQCRVFTLELALKREMA